MAIYGCEGMSAESKSTASGGGEKKHLSYGNIRSLLLTAMILVPFIPFILIMGISFYAHKSSLENGTIARMNRIADDHRQIIDNFLEERSGDIEFISNAYTFEQLSDPAILKTVFAHLKNVSHAFTDLGVFDAQGTHVSYEGPYHLVGRDYRDAEWFMEVMENGFYISDAFMGYRQEPHFVIAIAHGAGDERWVLRATIDNNTFESLVNGVHIGETGEAYIVNSAGVLQTSRRSGGAVLSQSADHIGPTLKAKAINSFIQRDLDGGKYLYATAGLKDGQWILVARQRTAEAFAALYDVFYLAVGIFLLGGATIVAVAFFVTDRIVHRMEKVDSEKQSLSRQLIGTSRLAELGEMAAGFAHEINNPLQIIKGEQTLIETLLEELRSEGSLAQSETVSEIEDSLDQIKLQITRCAKITQAILKFGRQSDPDVVDIDLSRLMPDVTKMIQEKARVHGIDFQQQLDTRPMIVRADTGQFQQVILNLLNNAIDAIIARHGVSGGNLVLKAESLESHWVEIQVTDNGAGISSENMDKIFSPFFTTKPVGEGTGLGLSVCYGIVESMGGSMAVASRLGEGTTFTVKLPCAT